MCDPSPKLSRSAKHHGLDCFQLTITLRPHIQSNVFFAKSDRWSENPAAMAPLMPRRPRAVTHFSLRLPLLAPITVTNTTCPSPATSLATSDYLPPASSSTTTTPSTNDEDSALTCRYCDHTSPHTSALLVTCVSIVERRANQCLEPQHTTETTASNALTAPTRSLTI
ncbi:unnamed protein product [Schistocephalus solidus]|uniref:Uncharacterized protein n=1 Tax=Schistocephalus solidus TaxID=70667 RepID=A0A183SNU0_SCHSO|nr:unnamed protein product [Schistocephalus solidus]